MEIDHASTRALLNPNGPQNSEYNQMEYTIQKVYE